MSLVSCWLFLVSRADLVGDVDGGILVHVAQLVDLRLQLGDRLLEVEKGLLHGRQESWCARIIAQTPRRAPIMAPLQEESTWRRIASPSSRVTASARKWFPRGFASSRKRPRSSASHSSSRISTGTATTTSKHGSMMPDDWFETLSGFEAIFYGAVGWPATVPDHVSLWGSLIQFRRHFDQYVNLRPCRLDARHPVAARQPQARRHRLRRRPREHRGRVFVGRRPRCSKAPSARSCSRNRSSRARASTAS